MIACSLPHNGFEEPETFKPSRWINEYGQMIPTVPNSIVQPFGCGKRICPGKKYVEMEMTILVIKVTSDLICNFILNTYKISSSLFVHSE